MEKSSRIAREAVRERRPARQPDEMLAAAVVLPKALVFKCRQLCGKNIDCFANNTPSVWDRQRSRIQMAFRLSSLFVTMASDGCNRSRTGALQPSITVAFVRLEETEECVSSQNVSTSPSCLLLGPWLK